MTYLIPLSLIAGCCFGLVFAVNNVAHALDRIAKVLERQHGAVE